MSGLAGVIFGKRERPAEEYERLAATFQRILAMCDTRGTDASGVATVCRCGRHSLFKRNVRATHLLSHPHFQRVVRPILRNVGPRTTAILGHARRGTDPSPDADRNNEPIRACHVIGTHDGRITNADELFIRWGLPRFSEADGEILFRIADENVEDGAFQLDRLRPLLQSVRGSLTAVLTSRVAAGEVLVIKGNRPIDVVYHSERAAVLYASERRFLDEAVAEESGWQAIEIPPMHIARFRVRDIGSPEIEPFSFEAADVDESVALGQGETADTQLPTGSAVAGVDGDDDVDDDDDE